MDALYNSLLMGYDKGGRHRYLIRKELGHMMRVAIPIGRPPLGALSPFACTAPIVLYPPPLGCVPWIVVRSSARVAQSSAVIAFRFLLLASFVLSSVVSSVPFVGTRLPCSFFFLIWATTLHSHSYITSAPLYAREHCWDIPRVVAFPPSHDNTKTMGIFVCVWVTPKRFKSCSNGKVLHSYVRPFTSATMSSKFKRLASRLSDTSTLSHTFLILAAHVHCGWPSLCVALGRGSRCGRDFCSPLPKSLEPLVRKRCNGQTTLYIPHLNRRLARAVALKELVGLPKQQCGRGPPRLEFRGGGD